MANRILRAEERLIYRFPAFFLYWPKVLTLNWWAYVLDDSRADKGYGTWAERVICRWRRHPEGVWWYSGGLEPDMHCKGCGEDLG